MTQVSNIITDSFRESNLIALNSTPSPAEMVEGLTRLQALVLSVIGNEVGYIMEDWKVVNSTTVINPSNVSLSTGQIATYTVRPQSRLIANLTAATTLSLDPMPQDGQRFAVIDALANFGTYALTVNGNGRRIDGATTKTFSTNSAKSEFLYRSDLGEWVELDALSTTTDMPFPADFDDYFITALAMRINPRYGRPLPPEASQRYIEQKQQIIDRYSQSRIRGSGTAKVADTVQFNQGG